MASFVEVTFLSGGQQLLNVEEILTVQEVADGTVRIFLRDYVNETPDPIIVKSPPYDRWKKGEVECSRIG